MNPTEQYDEIIAKRRRHAIALHVFPFFLKHRSTVLYNNTITDAQFNAEDSSYPAALDAFTAADAFLAAEKATTYVNTSPKKDDDTEGA